MDSLIRTLDTGGVRELTLNRPERLNALSAAVLDELASAVDAAAVDGVGCLVIRGAGERAFCAGADLGEIVGLDSGAAQDFIRRGHKTMNLIASSTVPVVAAVDGFALGGGFELMLACHIVIASDRSSFGLPEAKIGCMPGFGGTQRLFATVGKAAAHHLLLTGDRVDAQRAWQIGLLSVPPVPSAELSDQVCDLAGKLARGSLSGTQAILEAARLATQPAALELEAALAALAIASADGQEGIRAFSGRRTPVFGRRADA